MKIKTLAEILAESDTDSASAIDDKRKKPFKHVHKEAPKKPNKAGKRATYLKKDPAVTSELYRRAYIAQWLCYQFQKNLKLQKA